jgi:hypothetical protein
MPAILPLRAQSDLITELVRERLDTILPAAMDAADIDMWIILCLPWEQEDTGPRGAVTLEYMSAFVMELGTEGPVPEWGGAPLRLGTEEPVLFDRDGCRTLCPRQVDYRLI